MKRTAQELLEAIKLIVGEDNNEDSVLALYEDVSDSVSSEDSVSKEMYEELEQKYNKLDSEWRERYKSRFFNDEEKVTDYVESVDEEKDVSDLEEVARRLINV